MLDQAKELLRQSPGATPVVIYDSVTGKRYMARQDLWVRPDQALIQQLGRLLAPQDVALQ